MNFLSILEIGVCKQLYLYVGWGGYKRYFVLYLLVLNGYMDVMGIRDSYGFLVIVKVIQICVGIDKG